MNKDLMMAVLAMDAYGSWSKEGAGHKIANATLTQVAPQQFGFAAYAYSCNGEIIISYRGTDAPKILDALTGYTQGVGLSSPQAAQAASFYQTVVGASNVYSANVSFTGHSLGGGLAGLLGSLYGHNSVMFDNMAFRDAAAWTFEQATHPLVNVPPVPNPFYPIANTFFYPSVDPVAPDYSGISGYRMDGQFLNIQSEGTRVGTGVSWGFGLTAPIDLHSMALLVLTMYAEQTAGFDPAWKTTARYVGQPLSGLPANGIDKIAYSVVSEGERPNGDVAAHSLFDDAGDIGKFLDGAGTAPFYFSWGDGIAPIAVQFSAQQAEDAVMASSSGHEGEGIFHDSDAGLYLSLDTATGAWADGASITGWETLKAGFLAELQAANGEAVSPDAVATLNKVDFALFAKGGFVDLILNDDNPMVIANQISDVATASAFVYGAEKADQIQGTKNADFMNGDVGNDTLVGGDGRDALYGGAGSDVLIAGNIDGVNAAGAVSSGEVVEGGAGSDYLVVTGAVGDTVKVGKGDADDRLLVHTSLLGLPDGGSGDVGLFALLGGIYEVNAYQIDICDECWFWDPFNNSTNIFTDAEGGTYKVFYYSDDSNNLFNTQTIYTAAAQYVIEYRQYTASARLDIRILGAREGEGGPSPETPDQAPRTLLQTISIETFSNGDYGIILPGIFLPFAGPSAYGSRDAVLGGITDTALDYSLATDGSLQGARLRSVTPSITAENLKIAIDGSAAADVLVGNDVGELIRGHGGDDRLTGGGGVDVLDGGDGVDTADYQNSDQAVAVDLEAGSGFAGDATGDRLIGIENVTGSAYGDQLVGDGGDNALWGDAGNDLFVASAGADIMFGGDDNDVASYETAQTGVVVDLSTGMGDHGGRLLEIENLIGSSFGDVLQGDKGANTIRGGAGNDYIIAGNGADLLIGGDDNDTVSYETASTAIYANLALGSGANGGVLLEIENLVGSSGGDLLIGSAGGNTLKGGAGNDYLVGGTGSDALYGGADADVFGFETGDFGNDVIADFEDNTDRISFGSDVATGFGDLVILNNNSANVTIVVAGQSLIVQGSHAISLAAADFVFV